MSEITERFYKSHWGVFNHYLYSCQNNPEHPGNMGAGETSWERCTSELDVEKIARQLHEMGAHYYFFTLMQGRKYLAAPNSTFDSIAGTAPGQACCTRDIVMELSDALGKYGIDLYLYFTGDGPYKDEEIGKRFGFIEPRKDVTMDFVYKWSDVLREYALRYGDRVSGWWIDGCYDYFGYNDTLLYPYYSACKEGNPDAIVSLNGGVSEKLKKHFLCEEFVCGEYNDFTFIPEDRYVDGAQAHILAPLGKSCDGTEWNAWCRPGAKRDGAYMRDYISRVNAAGGVVTVDILLNRDGSFDERQTEVLSLIKI